MVNIHSFWEEGLTTATTTTTRGSLVCSMERFFGVFQTHFHLSYQREAIEARHLRQNRPWLLADQHVYSKHGVGITEADDRQVTTVFTVQPSFHHRHSTNRVSQSVTIVGKRAVTSFADDGNAS